LRRLDARALAAVAVVAVAAAAGGLGACQTVDLGAPPADLNACRPGQMFFIDQIWPNVLAKDYNGKHCYDASCHDNGKPLTLSVPIEAGAIPLPPDWSADYISASENMNCSNVKASQLLTVPSGVMGVHGGGTLFQPDGPEALLIEMWVSQP
jgi:hypothetical protein